jgi:hypothetical protein
MPPARRMPPGSLEGGERLGTAVPSNQPRRFDGINFALALARIAGGQWKEEQFAGLQNSARLSEALDSVMHGGV